MDTNRQFLIDMLWVAARINPVELAKMGYSVKELPRKSKRKSL